jgi:ABC-2 type transport system ATP-binding protein
VGADRVSAADGVLRLSTAPERTAAVVRELVRAGVSVFEVRPLERTLEEAFFEMTGAGTTGQQEVSS